MSRGNVLAFLGLFSSLFIDQLIVLPTWVVIVESHSV